MLTPDIEDSIRNNIHQGNSEIANLFYQAKNSNKFTFLSGHTACHGGITSSYLKHGELIGIGIPKYDNPVAQDYLEWLLSNDSVYYPVIKYSKDAFNIIRKDGKICGFTLPTDLNIKAALNFAKGTRHCNEHKDRLPFWKEFKIQNRLDPKLTFLLMSFFRTNGDKSQEGHGAAIDYTGENTKINLKRFLDNQHSDWDLSKNKLSSPSATSYTGENEFMWREGGNFLMYAMFPKYDKTEYTPLRTRFLIKYEQKRNSSYTKKDLENFYNVANRYV